jgi:hypothetical protein
MVPVWHGFVGVHEAPVTHALQAPLSQTLPAEHAVPFSAALPVPVSVHTGVPVPQAIWPLSQTFPGAMTVHETPAVHALHEPFPQTMFAPQLAPFAAAFAVPVSTHTDAPEAHDVDPRSQALPGGVHETPAVQATHWPLLHTWLGPQDVPFVAVPVSLHTICPAEHVTVPTSHGFPDGTHPAPLVQASQVAPLQ